ncbi:hypothetical protein DPEC_G00213960, partial [Dallia pectoralis]
MSEITTGEMSDSEEMDLSSLEIVEVKVEALKSVLGQRVKELKADFVSLGQEMEAGNRAVIASTTASVAEAEARLTAQLSALERRLSAAEEAMAAPHERRHVPEDEPGLAFSPEQSFSSPVSPVQMSSTTPGPLALDFDVALCSTAGTRTPDRATSVPGRQPPKRPSTPAPENTPSLDRPEPKRVRLVERYEDFATAEMAERVLEHRPGRVHAKELLTELQLAFFHMAMVKFQIK